MLAASTGLPRPRSGFIIALVLGAMAATAALHTLQKERYELPGALASLASFVGLAFILAGHQVVFGSVYWPTLTPFLITILFVGLLVATVSLVALGILTIDAGVLPRWCGISLIGGSPLLYALSFGMVPGVAWALVGFAVFRAAGRQTEQPSRVR